MPLWGAILTGVIVVIVIGFLIILIDDWRRENRKVKQLEDRCNVLENRDQSTVHRIIAEEVAIHSSGQEIVNIMRSAYATHYNVMQEIIVNGFQDRSQHMIGDLTDNLTTRLMASVQPIFNDVYQDESFILPTGIKHAAQRGRTLVVLIENQPGLRSATFTDQSLNNKEKMAGTRVLHNSERHATTSCYRFNLSFPYTYFLFTFYTNGKEKANFEKFNIFFRNKPLTSIRQSLYPAPLLNIGDSNPEGGAGYVCMGDSIGDAINYKSVGQMCDEIITEWWSRAFHNDLNEGDFRNSPLGKVDRWADKSQIDPYWACGLKWKNGLKAKRLLETALIYSNRSSDDERTVVEADCRAQVEQAAYEITKEVNHALVQLKPEDELTVDKFEPMAIQSFQNSLSLLTNKIIRRIT